VVWWTARMYRPLKCEDATILFNQHHAVVEPHGTDGQFIQVNSAGKSGRIERNPVRSGSVPLVGGRGHAPAQQIVDRNLHMRGLRK